MEIFELEKFPKLLYLVQKHSFYQMIIFIFIMTIFLIIRYALYSILLYYY